MNAPSTHLLDVEKVEKTPDKGIIAWVKDRALPLLGAPTFLELEKLSPAKRLLEVLIDAQHRAFRNSFRRYDELAPACRALYDLWNELIEFEQTERRRNIFRKLRDLTVHFIDQDTAYRWRLQWAIQRLDKDKFKLSEEDKYWFGMSDQFDHSEDDIENIGKKKRND